MKYFLVLVLLAGCTEKPKFNVNQIDMTKIDTSKVDWSKLNLDELRTEKYTIEKVIPPNEKDNISNQ